MTVRAFNQKCMIYLLLILIPSNVRGLSELSKRDSERCRLLNSVTARLHVTEEGCGLFSTVTDEEPYIQIGDLGQISDIENVLYRPFFSPAHVRAANTVRIGHVLCKNSTLVATAHCLKIGPPHSILYKIGGHTMSNHKRCLRFKELFTVYVCKRHGESRHIKRWMAAAGMRTWVDGVGNVHGEVRSSNASASTLVIGSHYDTVMDAGRFDGALGIIAGIAAVKALLLAELLRVNSRPDIGPQGDYLLDLGAATASMQSTLDSLRYHVRVVAFCDEEGARFQTTFLGSRALAGTLAEGHLLDSRDASGQTLREVLEARGFEPTRGALQDIAIAPDVLQGYIEVHMEQGPVLQASGTPLGIVAGIAGQSRLLVQVQGEQGHAGTVPMHLRHDPLPAAAEIMLALEQFCRRASMAPDPTQQWLADVVRRVGRLLGPSVQNTAERYLDYLFPSLHHLWRRAPPTAPETPAFLVCTVGSVTQWPGVSNVIMKNVNFTVDIRSDVDAVREGAVEWLQGTVQRVCDARGLKCDVHQPHAANAVRCDRELSQALLDSARAVASVSSQVEPERDDASCVAGDTTVSEIDAGQLSVCAHTNRAGESDVPVLVSGAGHDALAMADVTGVAMVFVRCKDGISHAPQEHVAREDVSDAVQALFDFLVNDALIGNKLR